jgi:hypothetical protein
MKTMEERLMAQERRYVPEGLVVGTQLVRSFAPLSGVQWSLRLGPMLRPLQFFHGETIEEALWNAEHGKPMYRHSHRKVR